MNKTAIKNFAIWARNKLISDIEYKAGLMGITEKGISPALPQSTKEVQFFDIGTKDYASVRGEEIRQREAFVSAIRAKEKDCDFPSAFHFIVEKVAYTWFNRLIAIRFMEVNDYLPSRIRVLSSENENKAEPDMVTAPFDTDMEFSAEEQDYVMQLKDENKLDDLFRWLFIKQCYKLHDVLPLLFDPAISYDRKNEYLELLLTISFTDKDGVLWHLVHDIPERDFRIRTEEDEERQRIENIPDEEMPAGQVEIIGWMYQYYNTEPKDQVFADLKKNIKISKDKIPAATGMFTPDWIVRYLVENSLGRLWVEGHPNEELKKNWKYYLEEAEQEPDVQAQLAVIRKGYAALRPEEIKVIDPCMGSGHILVYLFEVLMQIYLSQGWTKREAAQSIVQNNLFGLDIDERAAQLAYFAVMMKAIQYDRRFLERGIKPKVYAIVESNAFNRDYLQLFGDLRPTADLLMDYLKDAREYGSILKIDLSAFELSTLRQAYEEIKGKNYDNFFDSARQNGLVNEFEPVLAVAEALTQKYEVVVTNPPYMGGTGMGPKLIDFVFSYYPDSKYDLFSVCIEKFIQMTKQNGFTAMITMESWMFLASFERMRKNITNHCSIINLIHMPYLGKGGTSLGISFGTEASVISKHHYPNYSAQYMCIRYYETDDNGIPLSFPVINERYVKASSDNYAIIDGNPIAYWASANVYNAFISGQPLSTLAEPRQGVKTLDNDRFLKLWFEVPLEKIEFFAHNQEEATNSGKKWFPYNKGGEYRRWYGNNYYVVNWENDGAEMKALAVQKYGSVTRTITNIAYFYKPGLTWSALTTAAFSIRWFDAGFIFDSKGSSMYFNNDKERVYVIGFMNSKVASFLLKILAPTLDFNVGPMKKLPIIKNGDYLDEIENLVRQNVSIAKTDWNMRETSWDYTSFQMVHEYNRVSEAYHGLIEQCERRIKRLRENEVRLNEIFIEIYNLQNEMDSQVSMDEINLSMPAEKEAIITLVSFAVGCMFGRYSLDEPGLVLAGQPFSEKYVYASVPLAGTGFAGDTSLPTVRGDCYLRKTEGIVRCTFEPDPDNCIPITDEAYFEDDIVGRFVEFVRVVYGSDTLEENLSFIAKALGNKGNSSREIIRNYFLNDFFKDHCATYSVTGSGKRPIYWLFDSGKQNGFKALVYMHRWNADTIGNLRVEYLHRMQRVYEKEIDRMQEIMDNGKDNREISQAAKRREKMVKQLKETRDYDEKIAHAALSRVEIDLDDGVKVNYEKVQKGPDGKSLGILAKI